MPDRCRRPVAWGARERPRARLLGCNIDSERNNAMCVLVRCKNYSIKLDDELIRSGESRLGIVNKMSRIRRKTYFAVLGPNNNMTAGIDPVATYSSKA
jgi:hypothetical protein